MGGTDVNYPGPTAEETKLQQQQIEMLQTQNDMLRQYAVRQKQLEPLMFEAIGITPTMDDQGNITGFEKKPQTESEKAQEEILNLQLTRTKQALAGELPVDPGLINDLSAQEEDLRNSMLARLGPGWETSTPGIEALGEFGKKKDELLAATRRGDISMYEGLSLARQTQQDERLNQMLSRFSMVPGQSQQTAMTFGQAAAAYENPLTRMQKERANQMQAGYYSATAPTFAQQWLAPIGTFMQPLGTALGCWIAAAIYGAATPEFFLARSWIMNRWQGRLARLVRRLYLRVGPRVAAWIHRCPPLGRALKPLFDVAVRKGADAWLS